MWRKVTSNTSSGTSIVKLPLHGVARLGLDRSLLIILSWIFFNIRSTIPWLGRSCSVAVFPRSLLRDTLDVYFASKESTATSSWEWKLEICLNWVELSVWDVYRPLFRRRNLFISLEGGFSLKKSSAILNFTKTKNNLPWHTARLWWNI